MKMNQKKILLYLLILLCINKSAFSFGKWQRIEESPEFNAETYLSLKCADSLNCVILINYGILGGSFIRNTTDGGSSWQDIFKYLYHYDDSNRVVYVPLLEAISYPSTDLILAVGDSGLVVRSSDKGKSWNNFELGKDKKLYSVYMANENYGIIQSYRYTDDLLFDYETFNGGLTWRLINKPSNIIFGKPNYISSNVFYCDAAIRNKDSIWIRKFLRVYDNWKSIDTLPPTPDVLDIKFINDKVGWTIGTNQVDSTGFYIYTQKIHKTTDAGRSWFAQRDTIYHSYSVNNIDFFDEKFGMVSCDLGLMLITTDGGEHWIESFVDDSIPNGYLYQLKSIQVVNKTTAFVIAEGDYIYKYTRDLSDVVEENNIPPGELRLSPNPATDFLDISYSPSINRMVNHTVDGIAIYNVFGEEVLSQSHYTILATHYSAKFDVSCLPPGVYFVKVGDRVGKFIKIEN